MAACDSLYEAEEEGSAEQDVGDTCGGRTEGGFLCQAIGADTYGDNEYLDDLWDDCEAGDDDVCDALYGYSEPGTAYHHFGQTCGGRTDGTQACEGALEAVVG